MEKCRLAIRESKVPCVRARCIYSHRQCECLSTFICAAIYGAGMASCGYSHESYGRKTKPFHISVQKQIVCTINWMFIHLRPRHTEHRANRLIGYRIMSGGNKGDTGHEYSRIRRTRIKFVRGKFQDSHTHTHTHTHCVPYTLYTLEKKSNRTTERSCFCPFTYPLIARLPLLSNL